MQYFFSVIIGYFFGSIPTAYLVLQKIHGLDITKNGSGNVGAMNSYEVTNSKTTGLLVLFIDALKGLLSVYIIILIFPGSFSLPAISLIFAILSHCYNPWINFKGGRGLATSFGGTILIFPLLPIVWILLWIVSYLINKEIILSNFISTALSFMLILITNKLVLRYSFPHADSFSTLLFFVTALLIIIFVKHIDPLSESIGNLKNKEKR